MPEIKETTTPVVASSEVVVNSQKPGDVKVRILADRVEHDGTGYTKNQLVWIPKDAADYHASIGTISLEK